MLHRVYEKDFILQNIDARKLQLGPARYIILLIKFDGCRYCRQFYPEYKQLSDEITDVHFLVLDADENREMINHWSNLINPAFPEHNGRFMYPMLVLYDIYGSPLRVIPDRSKLRDLLLIR